MVLGSEKREKQEKRPEEGRETDKERQKNKQLEPEKKEAEMLSCVSLVASSLVRFMEDLLLTWDKTLIEFIVKNQVPSFPLAKSNGVSLSDVQARFPEQPVSLLAGGTKPCVCFVCVLKILYGQATKLL